MNSTNIWFGLGALYGGHFFAIGKRAGHALIFSMENYKKNFILTTENWNVGPGLGGGWGIELIVVTSLSNPKEMNNYASQKTDLTIGFSGKWDELAKSLKYSKTIKRLAENIGKAEKASQQILKLSFDDYNNIRTRIGDLITAGGLKTDLLYPQMLRIGIPLVGQSLELGIYKGFTIATVESQNVL